MSIFIYSGDEKGKFKVVIIEWGRGGVFTIILRVILINVLVLPRTIPVHTTT